MQIYVVTEQRMLIHKKKTVFFRTTKTTPFVREKPTKVCSCTSNKTESLANQKAMQGQPKRIYTVNIHYKSSFNHSSSKYQHQQFSCNTPRRTLKRQITDDNNYDGCCIEDGEHFFDDDGSGDD